MAAKKEIASYIPKLSYLLMPKKATASWIYFSKEKVVELKKQGFD
jgi:hypothetical protein